MAIQTGKYLKRAEQSKALKKLADKLEEERGKEGKLGGLMTALSPLAGIGSKMALTALGVGSGGLLTPLLMGAGTSLLKKWGEEGLRKAGMGADVEEIAIENKYGFGKKAASEAREGVRTGIKERGWSPESLAADVAMSYVSALTPTLGVDPKTGDMGVEGGDLFKAQKDKGFKDLFSQERLLDLDPEKGLGKWLGLPQFEMEQLDVADTSELFSPYSEAPFGEMDLSISPEMLENVPPASITPLPYEEPAAIDYFQKVDAPPAMEESLRFAPLEEYFKYDPRTTEFSGKYKQGGQVPKYRGGGTIADYFGSQGVTLGGSNKQSIGQILGKR